MDLLFQAGRTAVMLAAFKGQAECLAMLLTRGGAFDNIDAVR